MTMFDFSLLVASEQLDFLRAEGTFIGKIRTGAHWKILYQFESFYVEITYKKYRHTTEKIRCFASPENLDRYLDQVDIKLFLNSCLKS